MIRNEATNRDRLFRVRLVDRSNGGIDLWSEMRNKMDLAS